MVELREKFEALRSDLAGAFVEREQVVDGMLAAALAGEHVLLLGPPGTAKSALARQLCGAFEGADYFEWLLSKFSAPEELFGPLDLSKLKAGRYARVTDAKLPKADVAFLDEIFKANSGILNALLTAINERMFHDNGGAVEIPLRMVIGASNELPEGPELGALYDRFMVRFWVEYTQRQSSFVEVLMAEEPAVPVRLTVAEWDAARAETRKVTFSESMAETLFKLRAALARKDVHASDRRWKRAVKLLQAVAWLEGNSEVSEEHLAILEHCLWDQLDQRAAVTEVVGQRAASVVSKARDVKAQIFELIASAPDVAKGDVTEAVQKQLVSTNKEAKRAKGQLEKLLSAARTPLQRKQVQAMLEELKHAIEPVRLAAREALGL